MQLQGHRANDRPDGVERGTGSFCEFDQVPDGTWLIKRGLGAPDGRVVCQWHTCGDLANGQEFDICSGEFRRC